MSTHPTTQVLLRHGALPLGLFDSAGRRWWWVRLPRNRCDEPGPLGGGAVFDVADIAAVVTGVDDHRPGFNPGALDEFGPADGPTTMSASATMPGLTDAGVDVRTGVSVTELRRPGGVGPVTVTLDNDGELQVDEVLFATGRTPNTTDIGLETVDLTPGLWLDVDDTCRVIGAHNDWLYTLGDVNHRALLTHQGKYQARIVAPRSLLPPLASS